MRFAFGTKAAANSGHLLKEIVAEGEGGGDFDFTAGDHALQTNEDLFFGYMPASAGRADGVSSAGEGDGNQFDTHALSAQGIHNGLADAGGIDDNGATSGGGGFFHETSDTFHDTGVRGAEANALQVANDVANLPDFGAEIGIEAVANDELLDDRDG